MGGRFSDDIVVMIDRGETYVFSFEREHVWPLGQFSHRVVPAAKVHWRL